MKDKVTETIDRLRDFDSQKLQQEMTVGLADWHLYRAETARNRRQYLATTCVMLLLVPVFYKLAPTRNYRLAASTTYEKVVLLNNSMLGL